MAQETVTISGRPKEGSGLAAVRLLGQGLGLVSVGASLSGWTSWVVLPAVPVLLSSFWDAGLGARSFARGYPSSRAETVGLGLGLMLEMIVVRRHGLRALLMLLSIPLLWSSEAISRGAAGALLALAGWLARGQPVMRGSLWTAGGVVVLFEGIRGLRARAGAPRRRLQPSGGRRKENDVRSKKDRGTAEAGQAVLETALTLPIVLLALIGAVQFGMLFSEHIFFQTVNNNVAQAAARLGGNPESGELLTVIDNSAIGWVDPSMTNFTVDTLEPDGSVACDGRATPHCTCEYGDLVRVTGEYDTDLHILAFSVDVTLRARSSLFCWRGGYRP